MKGLLVNWILRLSPRRRKRKRISHQTSLPRSNPTRSGVPMSSSRSQGINPGEITYRLGRRANHTTRFAAAGALRRRYRSSPPTFIFVKMPRANVLILLCITEFVWQHEMNISDGRGEELDFSRHLAGVHPWGKYRINGP